MPSKNSFELEGKVLSLRQSPSGKAFFLTIEYGKQKKEHHQITFFEDPQVHEGEQVTIVGSLNIKDIDYSNKYSLPFYLKNQTGLVGTQVVDSDAIRALNKPTHKPVFGGNVDENLDFGFDTPLSEARKNKS